MIGSGFAITPSSRARFRQCLDDFWFEAYCVVRYLWRKELWYAKLIENRYLKDHFYKMALWDHQAKHAWAQNPRLHGG
jgi:hypothetical protein